MSKFIRLCSLKASIFFIVTLNSAFIYSANVDPTGPFGQGRALSQVAAEKEFILESIIHGDGIHTVVINGKVMKPNDAIGEYRLAAVNDQSVVLLSETQRLELHIFKDNVVNVSDVK